MVLPEKNVIVAVSSGGKISVFNKETKQLIKEFKAHSDYIRSIIFLEKQKLIITASDDKSIKIFSYPEF